MSWDEIPPPGAHLLFARKQDTLMDSAICVVMEAQRAWGAAIGDEHGRLCVAQPLSGDAIKLRVEVMRACVPNSCFEFLPETAS
jgi:hypothetical protein